QSHRPRSAGMEFQLGIMQKDEVGGRLRHRTVDTEHGKLNLLARLDVAADHQSILRVPAHYDGAAALSGRMGQLAVYPDLGIVIDLRFEHHRGTGRIEI